MIASSLPYHLLLRPSHTLFLAVYQTHGLSLSLLITLHAYISMCMIYMHIHIFAKSFGVDQPIGGLLTGKYFLYIFSISW